METKKWRTIRIGTRKSRLALVQTKMVAEAIQAVCPEVVCELVPLMTKGDKILKTSLVAFGGKGAFVEEFEQGLLNGEIDLAVHSAKDMPMDLSDGLCIGAVLKREDPRDVFVTVKGRTSERMPRIIGTGSPRRQVQIMERGDVECRLLRGNVDTRLEKLYAGEYDGIILAAAGLSRLGLLDDPRFSFEFLEPETFIPAGGQGIIAVEAKKGSEVLKILEKLNDREASRDFIRWIQKMNDSMGIPRTISGIHEKDISMMAKHADQEGNPLYPVPVLMDAQELGGEDDRKFYMLRRILCTGPGHVLTETRLSEELFVSRSSISRELDAIIPWLGNYNLQVEKRRNHGISLNGKEFDKRRAIAELFFAKEAR